MDSKFSFRRNLRTVRKFGEQLTRVAKIADLARGRFQIGRLASHHQEIHGLNDSRWGPRATIRAMRALAALVLS